MNEDKNERRPSRKLAVYIRQSQKKRAEKDEQLQEIKEANLFALARRFGFEEGNIIIF